MGGLTLTELLARGGATVVVLGLFSVVSIAIMLERAWAFRRFSSELRDLAEPLGATLRERGADAAAALCASRRVALASVFLGGYERRALGREEVLRGMELAGRAEIASLERFLTVLGTIGSTAPFIGLFGTVLGIIRAFSSLAVSHGATPAAVADGIAEALVATAAGLFVAVPAVMAYNYFIRTASRHALALETASAAFTEPLLGGEENGQGGR